MRIDQIRTEDHEDGARLVAQVTWEDSARKPLEVFFETNRVTAAGLSCAPDPFLIGAILPAFRQGEARVQVEGEVSPELLDGLATVMSWLRLWFRPGRRLPQIEARPSKSGPVARPPERAGFFFSGGVDSLATLLTNRRLFSPEHPAAIRDGLLVFGLEVEQATAFDHARAAVARIAAEADVTLVPLSTNVRLLDDDWAFWRDEFQGAALAAIGHALARRLTVLSIAATYDAPNMAPWGSHPLLDPNFSTHSLHIHHDGVALSRLDKVRLLLDWPVALRWMRVCNKADQYRGEMLNCGACEKCVRTMLELVALGALERSGAFPVSDVSPETAAAVDIHDGYVASCYFDLLQPLAQRRRQDLVQALTKALDRYRGEIGWRGVIKRFDRVHLNGGLRVLRGAAPAILARRAKSSSPPP